MKASLIAVFVLFAGINLSAKPSDPIKNISQQLANYFNYYPKENVFIITDKHIYKPGETIWFSASVTDANNLPVSEDSKELMVKLYNSEGRPVSQDLFQLSKGKTSGDLIVPNDMPQGPCVLVAYTAAQHSPDELSYTALTIDPAYSNQWIAKVALKDSISVPGKKNELTLTLLDITGDFQKNTTLQYCLLNGDNLIEKGKLKTDDKGKAVFQITMPTKTNGEPFFCQLSDPKKEWKTEIFLPTDSDPLVVKFYPEGGNLIAENYTKIGFTAYNKWGIPVDVKGSVLDQNGNSVTEAKSCTKGLGIFSLTPNANQKYKLVLSGETGKNQSFDLPAVKLNELALSVEKNTPEFIAANLIFPDKQTHSVSLTATQGTNINWTSNIDIKGKEEIKIPTKTLPQGINLLSVFSDEGKLLAERIVFIEKNQYANLLVKPECSMLKQNGILKATVQLTDATNQPLSGNLTITVSDASRNEINAPQIDEFLLLNSKLATALPETLNLLTDRKLLDIALISNNIKGFCWNKIRNFNPENAADPSSGNNQISGSVTDKNGNKINKAKVSLVNNKNMQLYTTITDASGFFKFQNLTDIANQDDFSIKATDPEGKRDLKIVLDKTIEDGISDFVVRTIDRKKWNRPNDCINETYFRNNPELLTKAAKALKNNITATNNQRKQLAAATNIMDVIKSMKSFSIMSNQIVFTGSINSINYQGGALLVVDGQQLGTDISAIQYLSPQEVDHINISTNPADIQRYTGLNSVGVIEIYLKKAQLPENVYSETTSKYVGKYRVPNDFTKIQISPRRDFRTSLIWLPDQQIDKTGQFEFSITASKVISDFIIEAQGITTDGKPVCARTKISVTK